jgi:hypothetical protein
MKKFGLKTRRKKLHVQADIEIDLEEIKVTIWAENLQLCLFTGGGILQNNTTSRESYAVCRSTLLSSVP